METSIDTLTQPIVKYSPYKNTAELAPMEIALTTCERSSLSNANLHCAQAHKPVGREDCIASNASSIQRPEVFSTSHFMQRWKLIVADSIDVE